MARSRTEQRWSCPCQHPRRRRYRTPSGAAHPAPRGPPDRPHPAPQSTCVSSAVSACVRRRRAWPPGGEAGGHALRGGHAIWIPPQAWWTCQRGSRWASCAVSAARARVARRGAAARAADEPAARGESAIRGESSARMAAHRQSQRNQAAADVDAPLDPYALARVCGPLEDCSHDHPRDRDCCCGGCALSGARQSS